MNRAPDHLGPGLFKKENTHGTDIGQWRLSWVPIRDDRAWFDPDICPDERPQLCPWADVCDRRICHLHILWPVGRTFRFGPFMSCFTLAILGALIERYLFAPVIKGSAREESTMLLAAGIAFFLDAVILLGFGEKQRGVPKIVDGVFNYDFRLIMPYDRILICVLGDPINRRLYWPYAIHKDWPCLARIGPRPYSGAIDGRQCRPLFDDRVCAWRDACRSGWRFC